LIMGHSFRQAGQSKGQARPQRQAVKARQAIRTQAYTPLAQRSITLTPRCRVEEARHHVLRNCLPSSAIVNSSDVGRPCGQWQRMLAGKASDPGANLPQGRARDQAAAILGVSPRSVEAAGNVLKQGTPELIQGVESEQVSVSAASDLAELPHDEQRDLVSRDKKAVAAKAKQIRKKKAKGRSEKEASDPKPGTGKREASGPDNEKPNANDEAAATSTATPAPWPGAPRRKSCRSV
jgi:hypothetical protein